MTRRIIIVITIFLISCTTKIAEWKTLDFGEFRLKAPNDWKKFKEEGTDAYVGGLTNGKDSLWFYYGWYISGFKDENANKYLFAQDTINGKIAAIKIPKKNGAGSIQMFIDNVTKKYKFELSSNCISDTGLTFQIFKSVIFNNSDTTRNGTLTSNKLKNYPLGSGRTIYYANCSFCHHESKILAGPVLTPELLNTRSTDWLYTFFKDRNNLQKDSAYLSRKKEFDNMSCIELTNYSREDIGQLISYLQGR